MRKPNLNYINFTVSNRDVNFTEMQMRYAWHFNTAGVKAIDSRRFLKTVFGRTTAMVLFPTHSPKTMGNSIDRGYLLRFARANCLTSLSILNGERVKSFRTIIIILRRIHISSSGVTYT